MAGRPVDHQRRAELLDAAVDYAAEHGFSGLSWRPIATALGVSTTTLVHHFGTKEELLQAILGRLRDRIVVATAELAGDEPGLAAAARAVWVWSSAPEQRATFRLFFAVYGNALQDPEPFAEFLGLVGRDWRATLRAVQEAEVGDDAETRATLVVATLRGLLLDLLASGDEARVHAAAEAFLADLARPRP
jgi:AcrR family transcriptional regulator